MAVQNWRMLATLEYKMLFQYYSSINYVQNKATDVYRSGLGINVDKINHANITPVGRIMLHQFRTQIQATAPLWKPVK